MKDHEEKIRNEERSKYVAEMEQKKQELLMNKTKQYFSKLPPRQYPTAQAPVQQQQGNMWDYLLNPRRKY